MSLLEMQNNIVMLLTAKMDERADGLEDMVRRNTMKTEAINKSVDFISGEVKTLKSDMKKVEVICQENEQKVAELEQKVNDAERYQVEPEAPWNSREIPAKLQENVNIVHHLGRLKDQNKSPKDNNHPVHQQIYTGSSLEASKELGVLHQAKMEVHGGSDLCGQSDTGETVADGGCSSKGRENCISLLVQE
ncbi:unnamed protein product [Coregonus sp. 'balchen']|nr:unnamed protein product [Coregonus sp. 'balchen']